MNKELKKEFFSEIRIADKLKIVSANSIADYSFVTSYKHDLVNNNEILFIDDEMNVILVENNKNIYDKVYIKNIKNISNSHTTKVKCDLLNSILVGTHKAFFNNDKKTIKTDLVLELIIM